MPTLTFTRASVAHKLDGTQVASGVPRYETGKFGQAIMVEEGTTNLVLWSEQLDNAYWTKDLATITANAATASDGTATMDKFVATVAAGEHYAYRSGLSGIRTVSAYGKAGEHDYIWLDPTGSGTRAWFNLATGAVGTTQASVLAASITPVGGGIYRCTVTSVGTGTIVLWGTSPTNGTINYTGDGTSGAFIWGIQAEATAHPTSYIRTEGATAARAAETLTIPTAGVLSATAGTIEGRFYEDGVKSASSHLWDSSNVAGKRFWARRVSGTYRFAFNETEPAALQVARPAVGWHHVAVTWGGGSVSSYLDEGLIGTTALTPDMTGVSDFYIGCSPFVNGEWNNLVDDLRISNVGRTAQEIAAVAGSIRPAPVD